MRGFRSRSSVEEVLRVIDARVSTLAAEAIGLFDAHRRILNQQVVAKGDVPQFDRAAMDGYALRGRETFGVDAYTPFGFRLIGEALPGRKYKGRVETGECVAIATGAPIPTGADAVAKAESSRREGETIWIAEPTPPLRNIGVRGEDIAKGVIVFEPMRHLRPQDLGVLSALGYDQVEVIERPKVAIVITGDEIDPAGSKSIGCRIPDMNGPMLSALVTRDGGSVRLIGPLRDDRDSLKATIAEAAASSQFVIISGGSSTGPEDHSPSIIAELGELTIHGVALRPASPTGLGFVATTPILLAPGNPVSCLCAYDFFGGRIIRKLGGRNVEWPYRSLDAALADKLTSSLGRVDYVRVKLEEGRVVPMATSGASILSSTTRADGFVVVPAGLEGYAAGQVVTSWMYEA
jgi:molybdopterin molybdotransferase